MEIPREFAPVISVVLLLLSIFALGNLFFNVENLDTGEEMIPEFPSQTREEVNGTALGADPNLLKFIFIGFIVTLVIAIIVGVAYAIYKGEKLRDYLPILELLGGLLAIAFILGAALFFHEISGFFEALVRYFSFGDPSEGGGPVGPGGGVETTREFPIYFTLLFLAVTILAVSLFMFRFLPSFKEAVLTEDRERARKKRILARKVRRTIRGLESGADFRAVIMKCYADMCFILAHKGLESNPSLTPREFEIVARKEIGLSPRSIKTLTNLFEVARYSDHEIQREQRDLAVDSLKRIQMELEVA